MKIHVRFETELDEIVRTHRHVHLLEDGTAIIEASNLKTALRCLQHLYPDVEEVEEVGA